MEKHYIIKQDIINFLGVYDDALELNASADKKLVHYSKIESALSHYSKLELLDYLQELYDSGYIYCSEQWDDSTFLIKGKGRTAYRENQFINEGKRQELEIKQGESVIATNESVKDTNRVQKNMIRLTALLSALTLIATVYSAWKDKPINVPPSKVIIQQMTAQPDTLLLKELIKKYQTSNQKKPS